VAVQLRQITVKAFLVLPFIGLLGLGNAYAQSEAVTLFVQTIVATNQEQPHDDGKGKKIGPQLRRDLSPVFQWKHYRQVSCQKIAVKQDRTSRIQLTAGRELEVQIKNDAQLELRLFRDGKLVRKIKESLSQRRVIMGGDRNYDEAWFVVVRRDKPSTE
jgi:hypothetical protein